MYFKKTPEKLKKQKEKKKEVSLEEGVAEVLFVLTTWHYRDYEE